MTALKVLLIIFGVLVLLGHFPIAVYCRYDGKTLIELRLSVLRLQLYPKKPLTEKQQQKADRKKAEKARKKKAEKETSLVQKKPKAPDESLKDKITGLLPFVKFVGEFLGCIRRKLLIKRLYIHIKLAGDDPAKNAVNTGRAWAAIASVMPFVKGAFRVRSADVQVNPDFCGTETQLTAILHIRLFLGDAVVLLVKYGVKGLKLYFAYKKQQDNLKKAVQK